MYVFFSYGSIRVSPIVKSPNFLPGRSPPEVYLLLSLVIHSRRRSPAATGLLRSSPFLRESLSSPFARGTLFQGDSSFPVVMPSHFMYIISTFVHRLFLFDTRHIHRCCPINFAGLITQVIYPLYQFLNLFQNLFRILSTFCVLAQNFLFLSLSLVFNISRFVSIPFCDITVYCRDKAEFSVHRDAYEAVIIKLPELSPSRIRMSSVLKILYIILRSAMDRCVIPFSVC